jgi:hypothetical protein
MPELNLEVRTSPMIARRENTRIPDAIGLAVLLVLVASIAFLTPDTKVPRLLWIGIYLMWAASAVFVWNKFDGGWRRWPLVAVASVAGAVAWYFVTREISGLIFRGDEPQLSKVFDVAIALMASPGITFIAIAGWARASLIQKASRGT